MNTIENKSPFFPNSRTARAKARTAAAIERNTQERAQELKTKTSNDARVSIPTAIKDFSRIKKAVDVSAPIDNTDKIAALKARIQAGSYEPDYDAIAEKMLSSEF